MIEPTVQLRCLDVGVLAPGDPRLTRAGLLPRTIVGRAPERFNDLARTPPPIASNVHYDAKLWRLLAREAGPRDLWWNVAR